MGFHTNSAKHVGKSPGILGVQGHFHSGFMALGAGQGDMVGGLLAKWWHLH